MARPVEHEIAEAMKKLARIHKGEEKPAKPVRLTRAKSTTKAIAYASEGPSLG